MPGTEPDEPDRQKAGSAGRRQALIAAMAVAGIAAGILAYQMVIPGGQKPGAEDTTSPPSPYVHVAPVPLDSQEFTFPKQPVPVSNLRFIDGEGRPASLADFHGRALLLNVWATWCAPCRREMPSLDRLQAKFDSERFVVLPLSIDRRGTAAVKPFYEQLGLTSLGVYVDSAARPSGPSA